MRILLVEDELDLALPLAKGLRQHGYAVDLAHDGLTGQEMLAVEPYDLAILDLSLPGLDGLELLHQARTEHPQLYILLLTARTRPDRVDTG